MERELSRVRLLSLRACCTCFMTNDSEMLGIIFALAGLIDRDGIVKWLGLPEESENVTDH